MERAKRVKIKTEDGNEETHDLGIEEVESIIVSEEKQIIKIKFAKSYKIYPFNNLKEIEYVLEGI